MSLERLQLNKVYLRPFEDSGMNRILLMIVVIVGESDVSDIFYFKFLTSHSTFSCYLLELVELDAIPFVDDHCELSLSI